MEYLLVYNLPLLLRHFFARAGPTWGSRRGALRRRRRRHHRYCRLRDCQDGESGLKAGDKLEDKQAVRDRRLNAPALSELRVGSECPNVLGQPTVDAPLIYSCWPYQPYQQDSGTMGCSQTNGCIHGCIATIK